MRKSDVYRACDVCLTGEYVASRMPLRAEMFRFLRMKTPETLQTVSVRRPALAGLMAASAIASIAIATSFGAAVAGPLITTSTAPTTITIIVRGPLRTIATVPNNPSPTPPTPAPAPPTPAPPAPSPPTAAPGPSNTVGSPANPSPAPDVPSTSVAASGPSAAPSNLRPVADSRSIIVTKNTTSQLVLSGVDPERLPLTFAIVSQPSHGRVTGTAPNLMYVPKRNFTGVDALTFIVSDGFAHSEPATITFTVTGSNTKAKVAKTKAAKAKPAKKCPQGKKTCR
jgi:hypothetical protein